MLGLSVVESSDGAKVTSNLIMYEVLCIGKRTEQNSGVPDHTPSVQAAFVQGHRCFAISSLTLCRQIK
jgi:hypothetical protein